MGQDRPSTPYSSPARRMKLNKAIARARKVSTSRSSDRALSGSASAQLRSTNALGSGRHARKHWPETGASAIFGWTVADKLRPSVRKDPSIALPVMVFSMSTTE